ncbi:APC amino acid permease [Russula earlei]|uniref:APC amino acid permease n=1 Tax=Russula earlei TaxID=71964 RepID=A0ACC0TZS4_9AGAM|nr:APC amino acid permease [Russula earlei]
MVTLCMTTVGTKVVETTAVSNTLAKGIREVEVGRAQTDDEATLERMGYAQELRRDLTLSQSFGVSFSVISVLTSIPYLFYYGLTTGGPAVMVWGWFFVSIFTMSVGLAMAEICSAYPTSGGPYFWAAMLSNPQNAPFVSWVTGWFNLIGQIARTAATSFACATFITVAAAINTDWVPSAGQTLGVFVAVLFAQGLIISCGVRTLRFLSNLSVPWVVLGIGCVVIAVLAKAPVHQPASFVFRTFIDYTFIAIDTPGWSQRASPAYVAVIGLYMALSALTGFDASAYMTEETHNAARTAPIAIVTSIGASALLGWILILALLFSMQDYDATAFAFNSVAQIFFDTLGPNGAIVLMVFVIGAAFWSGTFAIASNSRMLYAFCRDGAIPGCQLSRKIHPGTRTPLYAVWLVCLMSFIISLPILGDYSAYAGVLSIAPIGLYISFGVPIALRVIYADRFVRGPFHLGRYSYPIAIVALLWTAFITIVFCLPELNPVNALTFNYAPVAVAVVLAFSLASWPFLSRTWLTGALLRQTTGAPPAHNGKRRSSYLPFS